MKKSEDLFDETLRSLEAAPKKPSPEYAGLKLLFNPLPLTGIARDDVIFSPLNTNVSKLILEYLKSTYIQQEFRGLALIGDYGMGKSHLLKFLDFKINTILGDPEKQLPSIAVSIDNPGTRPGHLIESVMEHVGRDRFAKYLGVIILNQVRESYQKDGKTFAESLQSPISRFTTNETELASVFSESNLTNFKAFVRAALAAGAGKTNLEELSRKIIELKIVDNSKAAEQFTNLLFGDELIAHRSWDAITQEIETKKSSETSLNEFLKGVIKILRAQGFGHLYVLLDEFEDILLSGKLSKPKAAEYLGVVKLFVNQNIPEISIVIAVSSAGWREVRGASPGLADRFQVVQLPPLTEPEARELLARYLSLARGAEFKDYVGKIVPFDSSAVRKLLDMSEGNYRAYLVNCQRLIEYAVSSSVTDINASVVQKFEKERA
jgi:hypothetical protein